MHTAQPRKGGSHLLYGHSMCFSVLLFYRASLTLVPVLDWPSRSFHMPLFPQPSYDFLRPNLQQKTLVLNLSAILLRPRWSVRAANFKPFLPYFQEFRFVMWSDGKSDKHILCTGCTALCLTGPRLMGFRGGGGVGVGGCLCWMWCGCLNEWKTERCAGSWPCSAQTQQLSLRLAERKKQNKQKRKAHIIRTVMYVWIFTQPFFWLPLLTFCSNCNAERHCFTSLSLSNYSCLPLTVNFSVQSILFCYIPHFSPSQQFISCSSL